MAPKLYYYPGSPPCRTVLITAKALGLDLNLQNVREVGANIVNMYTPEYLKINPQRQVPALEDDGKIICDSHAIITYLASKYERDDSFYPKDFHQRAVVDERLHFDSGVLSAHLHTLLGMFIRKVPVAPENTKVVADAYGILETFLNGHKWVAGDQVTIADFSLVLTVSSLENIVAVDPKVFPKVAAWIKRAQDLPCFASDVEYRQIHFRWFKSLLA